MIESMSLNNCSLKSGPFEITSKGVVDRDEFDLSTEVIYPTNRIQKTWGSAGKEKGIDDTKIYLQVSPSLCSSRAWSRYKIGEFKTLRGCAARASTDSIGTSYLNNPVLAMM